MNLVVGNTSQLINYFDPLDTISVSSRNYDGLDTGYGKVILTFAEQRTYLNLPIEDYMKVNVDYTFDVAKKLSENNEKVILFGSSELWNNYNGPIKESLPFDYQYSHYIFSKQKLFEKVKEEQYKGKMENVFFIHPFNFNSPYRKQGFLFAKIFESLINKSKVEVGNINIFRDIIHPKMIVDKINNIEKDSIVGSGVLTNIREFTQELFSNFGLNSDDYIVENSNTHSPHAQKCFWYDTEELYTNLLEDTIIDIEKIIKSK
jgi:nucleoside-diphosphate-sugar epimerase